MHKTLRAKIRVPSLIHASLWLALAFFSFPLLATNIWEPEIEAFEHADAVSAPPRDPVLFVGSSSIRMWGTLVPDFSPLPVLNRGFGGALLSDVDYFSERIILPYAAKVTVVYAGENDLAEKVSPAEVLATFARLFAKLDTAFPGRPVVLVSLKPSPAREALLPKMAETNRLLKDFCAGEPSLTFVNVFDPMLYKGRPRPELFLSDGLHMNSQGYVLWKNLLRPTLTKLYSK